MTSIASLEPVRTLVVDDEPLAREQLSTLLASRAGVKLVGECADGFETLESLRRLEPELVFLDIQMPGLSGFEVVETFGAERMPVVVFVTAYDEHALRAFEARALDFLLKPLDTQRFLEALGRAIEGVHHRRTWRRAQAAAGNPLESPAPVLDRLVIRSGARSIFLDPARIEWVEAADYCVRVHHGGETYLWRQSMAGVEKKLPTQAFVRVHRSALVNVAFIREIRGRAHGDAQVVLADGTLVNLSRGRRQALEVALRNTR